MEHDIGELNRKYSTPESLLTRSGVVNSSVIRRDWFWKLDVVKTVLEKSKALDVFGDVKFNDRVNFITDGMSMGTCPSCGKPFISFKRSQRTYRLCRHKFNLDAKANGMARRLLNENKRESLATSLGNRNMMMSEEEFGMMLDKIRNVSNSYNFSITDRSIPFFHDMILKTEHAIPFDMYDTRLSERSYLLMNGLASIPRCMFCDREVSFRGRNIGYSSTCDEHHSLLAGKNRASNLMSSLSSDIDMSKYEIVSLPSGVNAGDVEIRCRKCGRTSGWNLNNGKAAHVHEMHMCRFCETVQSHCENDLTDFVKSVYDGNVVENTKKVIHPYELDIYVPDRNLAFEFDGIYWHSETEGKKDRNYHLMKTRMCERLGVKLVHVFETEWNDMRGIVESRIRDMLGVHENTVYARNCSIAEVSNKDARDFLDENHLQRGCNASVRVGLMYDENIVSLMTFSKPRFLKCCDGWELVRFCNRSGYHIPGGASRLLKWFERRFSPKSVLSYADRRWSDGNLYRALGFDLVRESRPNYWYISNNYTRLDNRMSFQKHKLKNILQTFDETKSEWENMSANGWDRIWDCGNLVFEKVY